LQVENHYICFNLLHVACSQNGRRLQVDEKCSRCAAEHECATEHECERSERGLRQQHTTAGGKHLAARRQPGSGPRHRSRQHITLLPAGSSAAGGHRPRPHNMMCFRAAGRQQFGSRAAGGKQSYVLLPKASCASCCGVHHVQITAWSVGGSMRSGSRLACQSRMRRLYGWRRVAARMYVRQSLTPAC